MENMKPPQFGYIYWRGKYYDVDPIGKLIRKWFGVEVYRDWDVFYRCKLRIQNKIMKLEMKRHE